MTGGLLVAGLGAIALGTLLGRRAPRASRPGFWSQAAGAACVAAAGFWLLADGDSIGAAFTSEFTFRLGVDPLSGFFLGTLGLIALPGARLLRCATSSRHARGRTVALLTGAVPARARGALLCARPAHVPRRRGS